MKECNYQELSNWFLCEHAQRRANDIWLNSGHPCIFSMGSLEGIIYCNYGSGFNVDMNIEQTETAQE